VAAISQQVSVVAVVANLLAGLAVGPATVLGMLGGLTAPVVPAVGHLAGRLACWCADWILLVGERAALLPGAAVGWSADAVGLSVLTLLCAAAAVVSPRLARRPAPTAVVALVVAFLLVHPVHLRWAPEGWFLVMCDVGQGDGLVIRTGAREAVVVDTGPDAEAMGRCLDDLRVESVPLLVLTHFHADHVDGIASVLRSRSVGEIWASGTPLPPEGSAFVAAEASRAGVPVEVPPRGSRRAVGDVVIEVVSPDSEPRPDAVDDGTGTTPNNASVVLGVAMPHMTALLTGDVEPEAQRDLARVLAGRTFDVLKVPHHGSARQDLEFLHALGASVALISVGADNDYGHPDGALVDALGDWGMRVARTDRDGAVALTWDGGLHLVRQGR
jgi:competence protein ComEC